MILCVDPGASGGIAVQDGDDVQAIKMPDTEGDILAFIKSVTVDFPGMERTAYMEEVSGFCGEEQPGSAMFKFGRGYGFLLGVLQTLGWTIKLVKPQQWQKSLSLGTKAAAGGKTAWKNKLKATGQRLYPKLKVTLSTADALLLLHYANKSAS